MLVVTGASGLLGTAVLRSAIDRGLEAVGLYHQHAIQNSAARSASVDLTDESATRKLIFDLRPNAIIHCAAATDVDWCEDHAKQAQAINVCASAVLAEIASALNARLIYISTDSVFDGKRGSYAETDEPAPINIYAESKLAGEREILRRNPSAIVARVSIYGWNAQEKDSLAEWILRRLEQREDVPGFTDAFFTPILVDHLAPILLAMLQHELSGLYHVTGSEKISKFEFARRLAALFGFDPGRVIPCRVQDANLRARRPLDVSLNTGKIQAALGSIAGCYMPGYQMPDVDSGLRTFRELRGLQSHKRSTVIGGEKLA